VPLPETAPVGETERSDRRIDGVPARMLEQHSVAENMTGLSTTGKFHGSRFCSGCSARRVGLVCYPGALG
jgi:hypothetical protein